MLRVAILILRRFFNSYLVSGVASIYIITGAFVSHSAHAVDLLEAYNQALKMYPVLKSQEYIAKSTAVVDPIARATAFFPTVTTSAGYVYTKETGGGVPPVSGSGQGVSLNLSQPIFNYGHYQSWRSAQWAAKSAFSTYSSQKQTFIAEVVTAYFAVLQAKENLDSAKATEKFSEMTLNVVKEQMKVGLVTIKDVNQALATYDTNLAAKVAAENAVQTAEQKLSIYTGEVYDKYAVLREDFIFDDPKGALKEWEDSAQQNNNALIAQRQTLQAKAHALSSSRGAYFPNVYLSASYAHASFSSPSSPAAPVGMLSPSGSQYTIALNLSWNLFNGFKDFETVKKNAYLYGSQEAQTAFQVRDTSNQVNKDYLNVKSDASQVKADLEAVIAGESAVKQALAQYQVGVCVGSGCDDSSSSSSSASGSSSSSSSASSSPLVNLLEQIKLLRDSQLQYSKSKYAYINDKLSLANDAGFLSGKQVIALNKWLTYKVPKDFSYKSPY